MSATTPTVHATVIRNKERMTIALAVKRAAQQAYDKIRTYGLEAASWVADTFGSNKYIAAIVAKIAPGARVLIAAIKRSKVWVAAGAVLTAVSTERGRRVLEFVSRPVRKAGTFAFGLWKRAEGALWVAEPKSWMDKARNWVCERMIDARFLVTRNVVKAAIKVGPHLSLDSSAMKFARGAGITMLGTPAAGVRKAYSNGVPGSTAASIAMGLAGLYAVSKSDLPQKAGKQAKVTMTAGSESAASKAVDDDWAAAVAEADIAAEKVATEAAKQQNRQSRRAAQRSKSRA